MTNPIYDITLAPLAGDTDHHTRCPWADPDDIWDAAKTECCCEELAEEERDEAAYRRYEEGRK